MKELNLHREVLLSCFLEALQAIEASDVGMFELRPRKKDISEAFTGDYDFIIDRSHLKKIIMIFSGTCTHHKTHLEIINKSINKVILKIIRNKEYITLELWANVELTDSRRKESLQLPGATICETMNRLGVDGSQAIKAALYITHIFYKNKNLCERLQIERLHFFMNSLCLLSENAELSDSFEALKEIYISLHDKREINLADANTIALRTLTEINLTTGKRKFIKIRQKKYDRNRLTKRIIPVIGPDGSGKTYICKNLALESLDKRLHFPYKSFFRNGGYGICVKILRKVFATKEKNKIDERISGYLILKSLIHMFFWAVKLKIDKKTLFTDRYGWDYLIKGIRRDEVPLGRLRMYRILLRLVPRPNRIIIMVGLTSTIFSRKRELSEEQVNFLYSEYITLVAKGYARRTLLCCTELEYSSVQDDLNDFLAKE